MSAAPEDNLDLFPQEEWYEELLRYGLYIGAAFQLIAILAIIAFPPSSSDQSEDSQTAAVSKSDLWQKQGSMNSSNLGQKHPLLSKVIIMHFLSVQICIFVPPFQACVIPRSAFLKDHPEMLLHKR